MNRRAFVTGLGAALAALLLLVALYPAAVNAQSIAQLFKKHSPAVVVIVVRQASSGDISFGSGFITTADGMIVTNAHVVKGASEVAVKLPAGEILTNVSVLYEDDDRDLAVLFADRRGLPFLIVGDSDRVEIGEEVVAIGSPKGFENTITKGIVSGRRRIDGRDYLQTDAPLSSGSSGGPILNLRGEVIGVAVFRWRESQNLNFAVPINDVKPVLRGAVAGLKQAREQYARQLVEQEAARRALLEEEARRRALTAESAKRAQQEARARTGVDVQDSKTAEERRHREEACAGYRAPSLVRSLESGAVLGELAGAEFRSETCYYIVRRANGSLWAVESSRARTESITPGGAPEISPPSQHPGTALAVPGQPPVTSKLPEAPDTRQPSQAQDIFKAASLDYSRGNYQAALGQFRDFVRQFPDDERAATAQHWIGDLQVALSRGYANAGQVLQAEEALRQAVQEFRKVLANYPRSDKAPMSLYKEALALLELKQQDAAQQRLQYLVDTFPQSPEGMLARARLAALRQR